MRVLANGKSIANPYYKEGMGGVLTYPPRVVPDKLLGSVNGNPYADAGCVLYLPGLPGSGSTLHDFSGQGNNGTITGAVWKRLPSGLWALTFDGTDDKVTVTDDASILTLPTFTWLSWVNLSSFANEPVVFRKSGRYLQFGTTGRLSMRVAAATTTAITITSTGYVVSADTWTLVATRYDDSGDRKIDILLNGVEQSYSSETAADGALTADTADLLIGHYSATTAVCTGDIALERYLTAFLTDAQISEIYRQERHLFGV